MNNFSKALIPLLLVAATAHADNAMDEGEILLLDDGSDELLLLDDSSDDNILDLTGESDELNLDENDSSATALNSEDQAADPALSLKLDDLWFEYGHFPDSKANASGHQYAHAQASLDWSDNNHWEIRAAARVDGYSESGNDSSEELKLDYDEFYVRYKSGSAAVTLGAQKVIWGRIDEFPPTDRLSTQDLRRLVIDDLKDRRLASLAVRYEQFLDAGKIDVIIYPSFREAELSDRNGTWYPINQNSGAILGLKTSALLEAIVKSANIDDSAPHSEGGAGIRFSSLGSTIDYGVTVQQGRQTIPYFRYNPTNNTIEAKFPRTSIVGGDLGFEALGGTLKFEAAWLSDVPATRADGRYIELASISWGAAWETFPGDGDGRLNLQITGQNLLDAPAVLDREELLSFNGSYEVPFANNNWRAKTRFNVGLDENDLYLNPEIAYTGWSAQEAYLELHYFEGDKGTAGGFHQDNSLITVGWRGSF